MAGGENKNEILKTDIDEEADDTSNANKGRLNERLKKIARMKRLKTNGNGDNTDSDSYGSLKRFLLIPVMFWGGMLGKKKELIKKQTNKNTSIIVDENNINNDNKSVILNKKQWNNKFNRRRLIKDYNVKTGKRLSADIKTSNVIKQKENSDKLFVFNNYNKTDNILEINKSKEIELLEKEILKLIKKRLVKLINEYEMLGSDFYVLRELLTDDIYYDKCLQNVKEIKKLLSKISALKDKYDYLKDNVDFDNLLELDDRLLQGKIIELKNKIETDNLNYLVKDYKILNEYQSLYLKIDKLQSQAYEYEDERKKRVDILKEKKIDFEKFKLSVYNYKSAGEEYSYFVKKQNKLLNELSEKVGQIDSYEKVEYIFKGYRKILASSFKYIGLLLLSPLKGIVPGIATQTIVTKNILDNLKKSFSLEEHRKMVYEAINYEDEINRAVNDMDYMSMVIDNSLSDVVNLKRKYEERFRRDENNYREYQEAIKQLNKIENSIIGSKVKVEIMKERMEINRKINEDKMVKVRKLNIQENNH